MVGQVSVEINTSKMYYHHKVKIEKALQIARKNPKDASSIASQDGSDSHKLPSSLTWALREPESQTERHWFTEESSKRVNNLLILLPSIKKTIAQRLNVPCHYLIASETEKG